MSTYPTNPQAADEFTSTMLWRACVAYQGRSHLVHRGLIGEGDIPDHLHNVWVHQELETVKRLSIKGNHEEDVRGEPTSLSTSSVLRLSLRIETILISTSIDSLRHTSI